MVNGFLASRSFEGKVQGGGLTGAMTFPDGRRFDWSARRAPSLQRPAMPKWGELVRLSTEPT